MRLPTLAVTIVGVLMLGSCRQETVESVVESSLTTAPPTTLLATTSTRPEIEFDGVTVTEDVIFVGLLADLTGPFSGQVVDVVDAQIAFWDELNRQGGIAGRRIELLIADTGNDVDIHKIKYIEMMPKVVMFSHSTGSEPTMGISADLVRDNRLAVPLTWYSGWSDPIVGANVIETGPNSCVEAINTIALISERFFDEQGRAPRVAFASSPGEYGQDSVAGARFAARSLDLDVVYDGEAELVSGEDISPVVAGIARSGADLIWITTDPITLASVVAGAVQLGYTGSWSGASPTFNSRLLDTALGNLLAQRVIVPVTVAPLGADVEGMDDVYGLLTAAYPDRYPSEALIKGYLEFEVTRQILTKAAVAGNLTPEGVVKAAGLIGSMSYRGLSPPNLYVADPNSAVSRASGLATFDKALFDSQGGLSARLGDGAVSPLTFDTPFVATDIATRYDFSQPCFVRRE